MPCFRPEAVALIHSSKPQLSLGEFDAAGWLSAAQWCASPNFDARPIGERLTLAVIHAISLPPEQFSGAGVFELFTNRLDPEAHPYYRAIHQLKVSAHFFIRRDGSLFQFVPVDWRAWHAGLSLWRGRNKCNDFSIGIELEGSDTQAFEAAQYDKLAALLLKLKTRYPLEDVAAHADIAPGRKTDPGPFFDWSGLETKLAEGGWCDALQRRNKR